jgi:hypothetical protein
MTSENLFVVKRTFTDLKNPGEVAIKVAIAGTYLDLKAAKEKATKVLLEEGYEKDFFTVYAINNVTGPGTSNSAALKWEHGDGVIVYAEGLSHEIYKVEIDTVSNKTKLEASAAGLGPVRQPLFYVVQTIIHYLEDRSGSKRDTITEGVHTSRETALAQAATLLLDKTISKKDFAEYDEYEEGTEGPFGPEVVIHAVKENGENILVSVIPSK